MTFFSRRSAAVVLTLVAAWLVWDLADFITWKVKGQFEPVYALQYHVADMLLGVLASVILFWMLWRLRRRWPPWRLIPAMAVLCAVGGGLREMAFNTLMWRMGAFQELHFYWPAIGVWGCLVNGAKLGLFLCVAVAVDHGIELAAQKEKAAHATALAQQAQLQMLRYQLNPHFLFNALNSIRAMILEDGMRARQMVTELAEFLRYSLDGREQESTIDDELQAIDNYLAIQRIRFEERLDVAVTVDPEARRAVVPCFLIHPLVENAVKHGMQSSAMPLRVEIEVRRLADGLSVRVSNTGRLGGAAPAEGTRSEGTGTGMKNIAQRLKLAFPGRHSFGIEERDGWVHARMRLEQGSDGSR
jgi:hypothetical protein